MQLNANSSRKSHLGPNPGGRWDLITHISKWKIRTPGSVCSCSSTSNLTVKAQTFADNNLNNIKTVYLVVVSQPYMQLHKLKALQPTSVLLQLWSVSDHSEKHIVLSWIHLPHDAFQSPFYSHWLASYCINHSQTAELNNEYMTGIELPVKHGFDSISGFSFPVFLSKPWPHIPPYYIFALLINMSHVEKRLSPLL